MTVNTTPVEINYTGDGSTTVFALPFAFAANAHVKIYLAGVLQNAGYSITGAGNPSGGTLTMTTAPGSGVALKARRVTPLTQDIDVVNNATVFASSLETGLDYALMRQQEEAFDRVALGVTFAIDAAAVDADAAAAAASAVAAAASAAAALASKNAAETAETNAETAETGAEAAQAAAEAFAAASDSTTRLSKAANLSDLVSASTARTNLGFGPVRYDAASGNVFFGSAASLLNNTPAGTKDGDINTGFGFGVMPAATSAYACAAFGFGALNKLTTGHSQTVIGYQSGHNLTTGIMNTLVGVDAGFLMVTGSYNTVVGHHCLNTGAFTGEGLVAIGQQTARNFTSGNNMIWIGRNAGANAPATGSASCEVIGAGAGIAASVSSSTVIGTDAVAISGAISNSVIIGKFAQYGGGTIASNALVGVEAFFRSSGGGGNNNSSLGYQAGYSIAGVNNTLLGYRAGYRSSNTTVNSAVCIGNLAGFNAVATGDLWIGNSDAITAHLIWGNFNAQILNLRSSRLSLVALPNYATTQAASTAGFATETIFYDDNDFVRRTPASPSTETFKSAVTLGSTIRTKNYTVATLPPAGTAGRRAHVTDAVLPTFLGALTGGGAVVCPVFDNGTAWVAG